MASKSGPDIIEDGLVLCLDAASKRSYPGTGTVWTDLKGGNNGTLTNMTVSNFSSDNGGVFSFDGTNEIVRIFNFPTTHSAFTSSLWVYSNNYDKNYTGFMSCDAYRHRFELRCNADTKRITFVVSNSNASASSYFLTVDEDAALENGNWYNLTCSFDKASSSMKIYINGDIKKQRADGPNVDIVFNQTILAIGRIQGNNTYCLNGSVGTFCFYNRALTADEVRQNYLSTKERFV